MNEFHKQNMKSKFTLKEQLIICNDYKDGHSTIKLGKKYNCCWSSIHRILKSHNIKCRDRSRQRQQYKINENFFDEIDSEEKAYFLGFLYADGGHVDTSISLTLQKNDEEILHKLNNLIQNKPIRTYPLKNPKYSKLLISNRYMSEKLLTLGLVKIPRIY